MIDRLGGGYRRFLLRHHLELCLLHSIICTNNAVLTLPVVQSSLRVDFPPSSIISKSIQHMDTQNHNEQTDRDEDQQREAEPAQHHGTSTDAALDAAIPEVLRYLRCCYTRRMLP